LFFDLIASFFYSTIEPPVNSIVPISGANYNLAIGDNGKTFLFDLPTTPKTFTVPAGLPIGFRCWVVKMYAASNITVTGSGGMAVLGLDPILNGQYARMEIFVTGPLTTLVFNIGG
jgi:hypothetical protein